MTEQAPDSLKRFINGKLYLTQTNIEIAAADTLPSGDIDIYTKTKEDRDTLRANTA
jgi:hypothetical protein